MITVVVDKVFRRCVDDVIVVAVVVVVVVVDVVRALLRRAVRRSVFHGTAAVLIQEFPVGFRLEPEHFHLVGIHFARIFNRGGGGVRLCTTGDACCTRRAR